MKVSIGRKPWILIFIVLLMGDLLGILLGNGMHAFIKPLLMPALVFMLLFSLKGIEFRKIAFIFWGLICSFLGDVFLLLETTGSGWFLAGLGSFLLTHICYIIFFIKIKAVSPGWWRKHFWVWISTIIYAILMVSVLWDGLNTMKVPVIIYTLCISMMVILAQRATTTLPRQTGLLFSLGSIFFMVSDSILAVNKFHQASSLAPLLIMFTYGIAQLLIVSGAIHLYERK